MQCPHIFRPINIGLEVWGGEGTAQLFQKAFTGICQYSDIPLTFVPVCRHKFLISIILRVASYTRIT